MGAWIIARRAGHYDSCVTHAPPPEERLPRASAEDERFRAIVESSPMGMHRYRLEADGRLIFLGANPAADRLLKIDNAQFVGRTLEEAFPPLASTEIPERYREVARTGAQWSTERVEYQDDRIVGAYEVHAFRTAPNEMVATFLEITQRKQTEEALRRSEEKYRLVVENQNDLVVKVDPRGRFRFASESFCRLFGETEARLLGSFGAHFILAEDRPAVAAELAKLGAPPWTCYVEHRAQTIAGVRWLAWSCRAIRDPQGEPRAFVGTGRDITDRRELEERLRQSEKLQAIGQIAGGVAHDFNNQLTGIMSNAHVLAEALEEQPELAAAAVEICEAARRSARLTAQLLAFARKGAVQSVPVDLHLVVGDVQALLRRSIDKRIVLKADLAASPSTVVGDPAQIHNALLNLALNARDAMPEGGELRFATRTIDLTAERQAALQLNAGSGALIELTVTDTGVGMDGAILSRIFEPFFTTKGPGKGSGLGLSAVYGTVKTHQGALDVRSAPGAGTTFTLWFPVSSATAVRPAAVEAGGAARRGRILVVDDEPMIRNSLVRMLTRLGHEVLTAGLGQEALATFEHDHGAIDLVILDMVMPDLTGPQVFARILELDPAARVVLSSGNALEGLDDLLRGRRAWTLQKPYTQEDLSRVVGEALGSPS
jgi:PAS domain S-box-containing protein